MRLARITLSLLLTGAVGACAGKSVPNAERSPHDQAKAVGLDCYDPAQDAGAWEPNGTAMEEASGRRLDGRDAQFIRRECRDEGAAAAPTKFRAATPPRR